LHGTDHPHAAVQTRDGPECNYRRYPAFVSPQSQSPSPFHSRTQAPACHETQTAHYIHTGRRGCMLVHAHRHLPCAQRPHTRCPPHTRSLTHSCLTLTHHTTHTRGITHPRCLIHMWGFAHTCRFLRARGFSHLRCPFHTRRAGKHARRPTRQHTTRTRGLTRIRGLTHTRGRFHTRGLSHTTPLTRSMRASSHPLYACVAARTLTHWCTRTATPHTPGPHSQPHTPGHSRWGFSPPRGLPGSLYPPSSACTRSRHDRIHLVVTSFKGAYSLPSFPREATQLLAPGPNTFGELSPIVPRYLCVCVRVSLFLYPRVVSPLPPVSSSARSPDVLSLSSLCVSCTSPSPHLIFSSPSLLPSRVSPSMSPESPCPHPPVHSPSARSMQHVAAPFCPPAGIGPLAASHPALPAHRL